MERQQWPLGLAIAWGMAAAGCLSDPEESGPTQVPDPPAAEDDLDPGSAPTSDRAAEEAGPAAGSAGAGSPAAAPATTVAAASGPWIDVSALPEVEIADIPVATDWATKVDSTRLPGWHVARLDKSIPRTPHMLTSGLFASKKTARRFAKSRDLVPAANGTCFKVVWPRPERPTGAPNVSDREPVLVPEPHVRVRGGWSSAIAWVQGTRWLETTGDAEAIRLEITEAWLDGVKDRVQKIAVREVTFARVDGGLPGFAMFGAREGARVHLLVAPLDDTGELVVGPPPPPAPPPKGSAERILDPPEFRTDYPCAWRRLTVDSTPLVAVLRKEGRPEARKVGRFVVSEEGGTLRLEVRE